LNTNLEVRAMHEMVKLAKLVEQINAGCLSEDEACGRMVDIVAGGPGMREVTGPQYEMLERLVSGYWLHWRSTQPTRPKTKKCVSCLEPINESEPYREHMRHGFLHVGCNNVNGENVAAHCMRHIEPALPAWMR
jgi:hypothetical protein